VSIGSYLPDQRCRAGLAWNLSSVTREGTPHPKPIHRFQALLQWVDGKGVGHSSGWSFWVSFGRSRGLGWPYQIPSHGPPGKGFAGIAEAACQSAVQLVGTSCNQHSQLLDVRIPSAVNTAFRNKRRVTFVRIE
jgi:hypothetical protein